MNAQLHTCTPVVPVKFTVTEIWNKGLLVRRSLMLLNIFFCHTAIKQILEQWASQELLKSFIDIKVDM